MILVISFLEILTFVTFGCSGCFSFLLYIITVATVPSAFTVNLIHSVASTYPFGACVSHNV